MIYKVYLLSSRLAINEDGGAGRFVTISYTDSSISPQLLSSGHRMYVAAVQESI